MRLKLLRRAAIPAAAKEKYNSRPCIGGLVPARVEHAEELAPLASLYCAALAPSSLTVMQTQ